MILGKITAIDNANGVKVLIDGEDSATTKKYSYLASYVPAVNDRVIIEEINGSYVILGKIVTDFNLSGIVRQADNATNAVNAQNAGHASSADSATNAQNATNAENALNATNATNASTSAACTGNSATATNVSSQCMNYEQGQVVTQVIRTYNSTLGTWVVNDIYLSSRHPFVYKTF